MCCEGFWRDFRCAPIGCSSDGSISSVDTAKSPISAKINQKPDFDQNLKIFFVLTALNHCKRFQRRLRFVWDVLCAFWDTIRAVIFGKRRKSSKRQSKKRIQNQANLIRNRIFGFPLLGAPPAPAGLVLVQPPGAANHSCVCGGIVAWSVDHGLRRILG